VIIRFQVPLIALLVIALAVLGYIFATSGSDVPTAYPTPEPADLPGPTPTQVPTVTPALMPTLMPTPVPTPEPLPYDGKKMGFGTARFSVAHPYPGPEYWSDTSKSMAGKFSGSTAEGVWVIGGVLQGGQCYLDFPSSERYPYITFSETDENEPYLDYFDKNGLSVILQVEPGMADVDTVLKLALEQYAHHPCITGVGVDVEWNQAPIYWEGRPVTDEEAARWYKLINTYAWRSSAMSDAWQFPVVDSSNATGKKYFLALTHWKTEKMPPTYREGIYFLYDGFRFSSISDMMNYYISWGKSYPDNDVGYYVGFPEDRFSWGNNADPYYTIADRLLKNVGNAKGIYWVGSSIRDIYPES
jgi:hypothetical protein